MSSYTRQQLENWISQLDVKANRVLDIGGAQLPVKGRTKSWDVKEYKILDLEQPHECKQKPDIIRDLNDYWPFDHNDEIYIIPEFDVVFCLEVSEYWWNPVQALKNVNILLKPGGLLYISFHFIYPVHNPSEQDYLRYTPEGVKKLLKETGFEIVDIVPRLYEETPPINYFILEQMRPAKEYDKHDWVGCLVKAKKI